MTRKTTRKHGRKTIEHNTLSPEGHMEIFRRLAAVKNMHGTPGPRRPKKG